MSTRHSADRRIIAKLYRAPGEPGVGGLWGHEAVERVAERDGLPSGGWDGFARWGHFNDQLRLGHWVAFGRSRKLGKRVLIDSPWEYDRRRFDDLGQLWGDSDFFTGVLFYPVADPGEIEAVVEAAPQNVPPLPDTELPPSPPTASHPGTNPGGGKKQAGSGKRRRGNSSYADADVVELAKAELTKMTKPSARGAAKRVIARLIEEGHPIVGHSCDAWIERIRKQI